MCTAGKWELPREKLPANGTPHSGRGSPAASSEGCFDIERPLQPYSGCGGRFIHFCFKADDL